ncbi:hypothetical protein GJ496_008054 [Pomphorhynchus laevis]|nr:hypothetical protein GJ496_008054 [Pomphorhynchus laevis]
MYDFGNIGRSSENSTKTQESLNSLCMDIQVIQICASDQPKEDIIGIMDSAETKVSHFVTTNNASVEGFMAKRNEKPLFWLSKFLEDLNMRSELWFVRSND